MKYTHVVGTAILERVLDQNMTNLRIPFHLESDNVLKDIRKARKENRECEEELRERYKLVDYNLQEAEAAMWSEYL